MAFQHCGMMLLVQVRRSWAARVQGWALLWVMAGVEGLVGRANLHDYAH